MGLLVDLSCKAAFLSSYISVLSCSQSLPSSYASLLSFVIGLRVQTFSSQYSDYSNSYSPDGWVCISAEHCCLNAVETHIYVSS